MKPHSDHDAIEATKRKLKALRLRTKAMDVEEERKEDLLCQLQMRLEAKRREKEYVGHKIRETMADTVTTLNELRAVEELEMLDSMLVEKNTQLGLQQQRHEMLLQQIENLETVLDGVSGVEGNAEEDSETSLEQWMSCCEHMYRHASAVERYCFCQTSHMVNHPVSVFYQSVRKMFRTTRERDERLAIECENIDALLQRALTMNSTIQSIEADYKDNMEEMRRSNQDLMEVIQKVGDVEAVELLYDTLQWVSEARNNALLYLKDGGLFPVDSELSSAPLLHGTADEVAMPLCARRATSRVHNTNDSCRGAGTVPLRSVQILRRPRLGGGGGGSTGVAAGLDSGAGSNNGGVGVAVVVGTPPRFAPAAERLIDLSPYRDGEPARDVEVEELRRQLAVAERDAHRIQQQYENLEEEAERELFEYETKREALEGRLRKAQDLVKTLEKEKSEWQALHQQMSLLIS